MKPVINFRSIVDDEAQEDTHNARAKETERRVRPGFLGGALAASRIKVYHGIRGQVSRNSHSAFESKPDCSRIMRAPINPSSPCRIHKRSSRKLTFGGLNNLE